MRKLGCCTWIFGDIPLADTAKRLSDLGFDGVELFGDWQNTDAAAAKTVLADHGLEVFSLTPADADISHPDPATRRAALEYYRGLADFAAELGAPRMCCHGQVARIRPVSTQADEDALLRDAVARICEMAAARGLMVPYEILNRYESHQIRTVADGLSLMQQVGAANLVLLADAYHMNIEESDPAAALRQGSGAIGLYHVADSNRCAVGEGHTDFPGQISALDDIGYDGPVILEVAAPGPDPFNTDKGDGFRKVLTDQLARSINELRAMGT